MSFLGRRYFKLPILSCPRIPPATQARVQVDFQVNSGNSQGIKKCTLCSESELTIEQTKDVETCRAGGHGQIPNEKFSIFLVTLNCK